MKKTLFLIIVLIFTACIPKSPHTLKSYDLDMDINKKVALKKSQILMIKYPKALGPIGGSRIYYKKGDLISYYLYSKWSGSLNSILYKDLLKAMQKSRYKSVVGYDSAADTNLVLESEIIDFYHIVGDNNSYAKITINIKLIDLKSNKILKNKTYSYKKTVMPPNAKNFILGAREALEEFLYAISSDF